MSNNWKVLELRDKESNLLVRRVGTPTHGIAIGVERKNTWDGGTDGAEYFPTIEEIEELIAKLTQIKEELKENK